MGMKMNSSWLLDVERTWRWCGRSIYAPQPGPHCRIRNRGAVSMWEDERRRAPDADE
jgi:hypothetical protein